MASSSAKKKPPVRKAPTVGPTNSSGSGGALSPTSASKGTAGQLKQLQRHNSSVEGKDVVSDSDEGEQWKNANTDSDEGSFQNETEELLYLRNRVGAMKVSLRKAKKEMRHKEQCIADRDNHIRYLVSQLSHNSTTKSNKRWMQEFQAQRVKQVSDVEKKGQRMSTTVGVPGSQPFPSPGRPVPGLSSSAGSTASTASTNTSRAVSIDSTRSVSTAPQSPKPGAAAVLQSPTGKSAPPHQPAPQPPQRLAPKLTVATDVANISVFSLPAEPADVGKDVLPTEPADVGKYLNQAGSSFCAIGSGSHSDGGEYSDDDTGIQWQTLAGVDKEARNDMDKSDVTSLMTRRQSTLFPNLLRDKDLVVSPLAHVKDDNQRGRKTNYKENMCKGKAMVDSEGSGLTALAQGIKIHLAANITANRKNLELIDILSVPQYTVVFREFMGKSMCLENLNFLEVVRAFETTQVSHVDEDNLEETAFFIYKDFVDSATATQLVNIDGETVERLLSSFQNDDISSTVFTRAADCVFNMIERDVYRRFLFSQEYKDMLAKTESQQMQEFEEKRRQDFDFAVCVLEEDYSTIFELADALFLASFCKTRRIGVRKFKRCFSGIDLVDFLVQYEYAATKMAGLFLAQRLIDAATMMPVEKCERLQYASNVFFQLVTHKAPSEKKWASWQELVVKPKAFYGEALVRGVRYCRVSMVLSPKDRMLFMWRSGENGEGPYNYLNLKGTKVVFHVKKELNYKLTDFNSKRRSSPGRASQGWSGKKKKPSVRNKTPVYWKQSETGGEVVTSDEESDGGNFKITNTPNKKSAASMMRLGSFGGTAASGMQGDVVSDEEEPMDVFIPGSSPIKCTDPNEPIEIPHLSGFYVVIGPNDQDETCLKIQAINTAKGWEQAFSEAKACISLVVH